MGQNPSQYSNIYMACDSYKDQPIKIAERVLRCHEDEIVIRTPDIRIPANCKRFLSNDKNKERMVELMEKVWLVGAHYTERASS